MSSQLLEKCINHLEHHGLDPVFRSHFGQVKSHLLSSADVASGLTRLTAQAKDFDDAACQLLELLLDEARMGLENDNEYAADFLETVEMAVEAGMSAGAIGHENLAVFAGLYRSADLPVPPAFIIDPTTVPRPQDFDDFDPSENLESIARDVIADGGSAYEVFNAIYMMQAAMPEEIQAFMAHHIATIDSSVFERCALFMLLSGSELVQEATITGLSDRLDQSVLDPATQTFLPMIRGWFTAGPVQAGLDRIIRKARAKSLPVQCDGSDLKIEEIVASVTDGAGAQSICVIMKQSSNTVLAMIMIKAGYGIKDSFLTPPAASDEAEQTIAELRVEIGADSISGDTLRVLLESALADGLKNGHLPAPGFLDVIEACNLFDLRPQALDLQALLNLADPERKIQEAAPQALGRWINDDLALDLLEPLTDSWFEDTAKTRDIVAQGRTSHSIETGIWKYLDTRRDIWARRFLQTAVMLREGKRVREWKTLTASAHGLMEGRPLKRIPLMEDVMDLTLDAASMKLW